MIQNNEIIGFKTIYVFFLFPLNNETPVFKLILQIINQK